VRSIRTTAAGVGRSAISTAEAPTASGKVRALPSPYAKNSLAAEKTTSSSPRPSTPWAYSAAVCIRCPCRCIAPLGVPVEPDEYSQNATSSAVVGAGASSGAAAARSASRERAPAGGASVVGSGDDATTIRSMPAASIPGASLPARASLTTTARARLSRSRNA